jgi:hypothetical protein
MTTRGFAITKPNVFGTEYQNVTGIAETSTNSTTVYSTKLTLTTPATLPSGTYLLSWTHVWRALGANRAMDFRIRRSTTDLITTVEFSSNVSTRELKSGFVNTGTISGANTFTMEFKVNGSGTTVYIRDASLQLWRIS